MVIKCCVHIISSDELVIPTYSEEYSLDAHSDIYHITYIIKYIFNKGLCRIYGKFKQNEYREMTANEIMIPLAQNNFIQILGVLDILYVYIPSTLSQRQYEELKKLSSKFNGYKVALNTLGKTKEKGSEFVSLGEQFTYQDALDYISINYLTKPSKYSR